MILTISLFLLLFNGINVFMLLLCDCYYESLTLGLHLFLSTFFFFFFERERERGRGRGREREFIIKYDVPFIITMYSSSINANCFSFERL